MEWIRHQKATDPKNPILLTLNFPAPHGPEDAAKKYQSVFNNTRVQRVTREQFANYNNIEQNPNKNWLLSQIRERLDPETEMFGDILCQKRLQVREGSVRPLYNYALLQTKWDSTLRHVLAASGRTKVDKTDKMLFLNKSN